MTNESTTYSENTATQADVQPASPSHASGQTIFAEHKPKRTLGLRLFDNLLYTVFTNTTVFFASIAFTYMTKHGHSVGAEGSKTRAVGSWFAKRRAPIMRGFEKLGIKSEVARDDATTVLFSFLDGTIFSLMVKPLEDRREKIAKKIDDALGTSPENMRAYDAEPKQSWRSVLEGRALTSLIVLPVAMTMEKTGGNKAIFYKSGDKLAGFVKNSLPKLDSWLSKKTIHHKNYFFQTAVFEAFYTSVCTAGLYIISRTVARKHPKPEKQAHPAHSHMAPSRDEAAQEVADTVATPEKPAATVSNPTLLSRVSEARQTAELTA